MHPIIRQLVESFDIAELEALEASLASNKPTLQKLSGIYNEKVLGGIDEVRRKAIELECKANGIELTTREDLLALIQPQMHALSVGMNDMSRLASHGDGSDEKLQTEVKVAALAVRRALVDDPDAQRIVADDPEVKRLVAEGDPEAPAKFLKKYAESVALAQDDLMPMLVQMIISATGRAGLPGLVAKLNKMEEILLAIDPDCYSNGFNYGFIQAHSAVRAAEYDIEHPQPPSVSTKDKLKDLFRAQVVAKLSAPRADVAAVSGLNVIDSFLQGIQDEERSRSQMEILKTIAEQSAEAKLAYEIDQGCETLYKGRLNMLLGDKLREAPTLRARYIVAATGELKPMDVIVRELSVDQSEEAKKFKKANKKVLKKYETVLDWQDILRDRAKTPVQRMGLFAEKYEATKDIVKQNRDMAGIRLLKWIARKLTGGWLGSSHGRDFVKENIKPKLVTVHRLFDQRKAAQARAATPEAKEGQRHNDDAVVAPPSLHRRGSSEGN